MSLPLTKVPDVPYLFFMSVETLGEAWNESWDIRVRCLFDGQDGLKHGKPCGYRATLDMGTLVATRGRAFPLARIAERLRCPRCGCRRVGVMFGPPNNRFSASKAVGS